MNISYDVYQHQKNPEFRLIVPSGRALPSQASAEEWGFAKVCISRVWPEAEAHVKIDGYYLYKMSTTFLDIEKAKT